MNKLLFLLLLWTSPAYAVASFDNAASYIDIPPSASINDINSSDSSALGFSISSYVFPIDKGGGGFGDIVAKASTSGADGRWWFEIDPNAAACTACIGFFKAVQGTDLTRQSTTNMTLNKWNHVAMTWDGTKTATGIRIYIDGVEVAYGTTTNGAGNDSDSAQTLSIGNDSTSGSTTDTWHGRISDVAIWSGVISPDEVRSLAGRVHGLPLTVRKKNLRGYWPLDDYSDNVVPTTIYNDRSGNGNHGTPITNVHSYADDNLSYQ